MNGFVLAAAVLASALAGGALAWPIARLGRRQMVRELQASVAAEAALRPNESASLAATLVASWKWDIAGGEVSWSPVMYSLFGLDVGSAPPSRARLMAMIHAQDRGRVTLRAWPLARSSSRSPIWVQV